MRFIDSMPTEARVTPPVPPRMMRSAGMLMNEAGLVPSIIELMSSEPKATPIPMAVEAFIAHTSACANDPSILPKDVQQLSQKPKTRSYIEPCVLKRRVPKRSCPRPRRVGWSRATRSEEHTSELQ